MTTKSPVFSDGKGGLLYLHILNSITKFTVFGLFFNALERPISCL